MSGYSLSVSNIITKLIQRNVGLLMSTTRPSIICSQWRDRHTKHWNPKWKKWRTHKVIKVKLPNFEADENGGIPNEKIRSKMKEMGLQPSNPWIERPIFIGCTGGIFEAYVPPEGDGKFSAISSTGVKQKVEFMTKKGRSYLAVKKIRRFEEEFSLNEFEDLAEGIYIKTHEAIAKKDKDGLRQLVTERAYPEVLHNTLDKTMRWKFFNSLQDPQVVHARCTDILSKENIFAQITVRFHTQQTLAVYDRFGRLMHGSEILKKDVLEYVVFERHMANGYGLWRIHAKIIPSWMPPREFGGRTYIESHREVPAIEESVGGTEVSTVPEISKDIQSITPNA